MRLFLIAIFSLLSLELSSQQSALPKLLSAPPMQHASLSVTVMELSTGKTVLEHEAGTLLVPASILKLVTTATGLEMLGADHRFNTSLGFSGEIDGNGVLKGDIIITGGGDPTLGSKRFGTAGDDPIKRLALGIKALGITSIEGRVVTDDNYFDFEPVVSEWLWEDIGNYYGAGVYGLNLYDNSYELDFKTGNEGSRPIMKNITPAVDINLTNNLIAYGTTDNGYIYAAPYNNAGWISGTIPPNRDSFVLKGAITDPPLLAAQLLTGELEKSGITISLPPSTSRLEGKKSTEKCTIINTITSPTLSEIIRATNHESVNLYAETIIKEIDKISGGPGSYVGGLLAVNNFLNGTGLATDGLKMADGSGLSTRSTVSSLFMAELLRYMANSKNGATFIASIPMAGTGGTIKNNFKDPVFASALRAKSGSMEGVRSYAGYITAKSGKQLSYCVIVNNFSGPSSPIVGLIEDLLKEVILNN